MKNKIKNYLFINSVIMCMWFIMIEKIDLLHFMIGFMVSNVSIYLTYGMLRYPLLSLPFSITFFIKYFLILFYEIYKGGFEQAIRLFKLKSDPNLVEVTTELEKEFNIALLANSITLTPGTITIDRKGKKLLVLSVEEVSEEGIKGNLERMLKQNDV